MNVIGEQGVEFDVHDIEVGKGPNIEHLCKTITNDAPLDEDGRERIKELLWKYRSLFMYDEDSLGLAKGIQHEIPNDGVPVRQQYRRIPPTLYQEVKEHIEDLLRKGVIRHSKSNYASPIVVVRKRNGKLRLCVDYRQLHTCTRRDVYPLPRIDDCWDSLYGSRLYSVIDLCSAYKQIEVNERDRHKTVFISPMEPPLTHSLHPLSPATFQRLMQLAFQDQLFLQVIVYLDDIIIFSKTLEEHITRLESVFDKLQEYGLQIEPPKCHFFLPEVIFLGHKVSASGISIDPEKTEAITSWKTPGNSQELLSFLSTVAYLRRYVKDFSKIAAPLRRLINEDPNEGKRKRPRRKWKHHSSAWNWDQECQQAFNTLKTAITTAPVLGYADFTQPFILEVDASHKGLGAVLFQDQDGKR